MGGCGSIFLGFGVGASRDLTRKIDRGELLGSRRIASTVSINTIYPNAFVYILFLVPIHFLKTIQRAAQQALGMF